jgi:hypothetical protein
LISASGDPAQYSLFGPPHYKEGYLTRYTPSRLLKLPLEIRRTIYTYALSHSGGLRCAVKDFKTTQRCDGWEMKEPSTVKLQASQDASIEGAAVNPMRLVCRQMYGETSGLLLKNNDLHFLSTRTPHFRLNEHAEQILELFLQQAKPANLALLKNVTITTQTMQNTSTGPSIFGLLNKLSQSLCAANPHIKVLVHDEWFFDSPEWEWIIWAVALQKAIRGETTIEVPDDVRQLAFFQEVTETVASTPPDPVPANLRLRIGASFPDGLEWREDHMQGRRVTDKVVKQAEKLFEEGI